MPDTPKRSKSRFADIQAARAAEEDAKLPKGLRCPCCGGVGWHVTHTVKHMNFIERRRECLKCKARVFTREKIAY